MDIIISLIGNIGVLIMKKEIQLFTNIILKIKKITRNCPDFLQDTEELTKNLKEKSLK